MDVSPDTGSPAAAGPLAAPRCVIALGANLGRREETIVRALLKLAAWCEPGTLRCSSIYETPPWGVVEQPAFANAACLARIAAPAEVLLDRLRALERELGRPERHPKWGPRLIDLDLIWIEGVEVDRPELTLPHPRAAERDFVLAPVREIAPEVAALLSPPLPGESSLPVLLAASKVEVLLGAGLSA